ncbi:metal-dependent hydrolase [Modestobacter sp. I12A-02662]|uniref:metal-dependent hydrolase n=1 Tax=Modestobacter sp. I12A-02662 TaxID=1730496 RepID=UPI0034DFA4D1
MGGRPGPDEPTRTGRSPRPAERLLPVALLLAVLVLDGVIAVRHWPLPLLGGLDELAHLATAGLLLTALLPERRGRLRPWALVGAVAIDIDHVPMYCWDVGSASSGRPGTHSLAVVLVLLAAGTLSRRLRVPLCGLALGVLCHLVRDVATGPGVPLLWPLTGTSVSVPYVAHVAVLTSVAMAAAFWRGPSTCAPDGAG